MALKVLILSIIATACFFFVSCSSSEDKNEPAKIETNLGDKEIQKREEIVTSINNSGEIKPGDYYEYHPSGGIKIRGFYNNNLKREGLWISYYENGTKWSEAYYLNGLRDGHSLTFYPNGKVRYIGEYKADQKIGEWTFYDEAGNISKTEKY